MAKAFAVWLAILVCAIANGGLREAVLIPQLGKTPGLMLSGLLLSALILGIASLTLPWLRVSRRSQLVVIGLGWVALTITFELTFGRLQGKSWASLLEAYTLKDGNIWAVVVLVTAAAPAIAGRLRGLPR